MTAVESAATLDEFGNSARLAELVAHLALHPSIYHARHLPAKGDLNSIALAEQWAQIPMTTKAELLEDQASAPPYGHRLIADAVTLRLVVESSGSTSGIKEIHVLSSADEATVIAMMSSAFATVGLSESDCVAVTLPISTAGGGVKIYHAVREMGALTLRLGSVSTEEKVAAIQMFHPTAIVATPSYLDRLSSVIRMAGGRTEDLGVKYVLIATQSVSAAWVQRTEKTWNAKVHEWYGNASGFFAMTCGRGVVDDGTPGTLHWDPEFQLLEVLDSAGMLVSHGQTGELVGTHLSNSTSPLIRYRLGDEAELVARGKCRCRSSLPGLRAGSIRRADGMVKFRGVSLWPSAVDRALEGIRGIDSSWVVLRQNEDTREVAELYVRPATSSLDYDNLAALVRQSTGVRFSVIPWENDLPPEACRAVSPSGKSPRWVDLREHRGQPMPDKAEGENK